MPRTICSLCNIAKKEKFMIEVEKDDKTSWVCMTCLVK